METQLYGVQSSSPDTCIFWGVAKSVSFINLKSYVPNSKEEIKLSADFSQGSQPRDHT